MATASRADRGGARRRLGLPFGSPPRPVNDSEENQGFPPKPPFLAAPLRKRLSLSLSVQYATRARGVPMAAAFRKWVRAALQNDATVTVRIVGQTEGRALNREYRGRDYPTNVLTFVLKDSPPYHGDLALCAPVVSREARAQGKTLAAHYAHLTVHGVLHL